MAEPKWRRSEFISIGTALLFAGYIWKAAQDSAHWNTVSVIVEDQAKGVIAHETRLEILEDHDKYREQLMENIADAVGARKPHRVR